MTKQCRQFSRPYLARFWKLPLKVHLMLSLMYLVIFHLWMLNDASTYVQNLTGEDTNIIFGALYDDKEADFVRITVIATGLDDETTRKASVSDKKTVGAGRTRTASQQQSVQEPKQPTGFQQPTFQQPTFQQPNFQPTQTTFTSNVKREISRFRIS